MDDKKITPWIVPRWAIVGFCELICDDMYVSQIIEHNPDNYLVLTCGINTWIFTNLNNYLTNLWEAPALYEEYEANVQK